MLGVNERGNRQVSLPISLVERIERYLNNRKEEEITSVAGFVKQAIREKIECASNSTRPGLDALGTPTDPPITSKKVIISTLGYRHEPVIHAVEKFGGDQLFVLHDFRAAGPVKIDAILNKIRTAISRTKISLEVRAVNHLELNLIVKLIRKWIQEKVGEESKVFLNLGGGAQKLTVAMLLASYLEFDKITGLFHFDRNEGNLANLPIFPLRSSELKKVKGIAHKHNKLGHLLKNKLSSKVIARDQTSQGTVIISTLGYRHKLVSNVINEFEVTKLFLLHNFPRGKIDPVIANLKKAIRRSSLTTEIRSVNQFDVSGVVNLLCKIIQEEFTAGHDVFLNLGGGAQRLIIAMLLGSYLEFERIDRLFYLKREDGTIEDLPVLPWRIKEKDSSIPKKVEKKPPVDRDYFRELWINGDVPIFKIAEILGTTPQYILKLRRSLSLIQRPQRILNGILRHFELPPLTQAEHEPISNFLNTQKYYGGYAKAFWQVYYYLRLLDEEKYAISLEGFTEYMRRHGIEKWGKRVPILAQTSVSRMFEAKLKEFTPHELLALLGIATRSSNSETLELPSENLHEWYCKACYEYSAEPHLEETFQQYIDPLIQAGVIKDNRLMLPPILVIRQARELLDSYKMVSPSGRVAFLR